MPPAPPKPWESRPSSSLSASTPSLSTTPSVPTTSMSSSTPALPPKPAVMSSDSNGEPNFFEFGGGGKGWQDDSVFSRECPSRQQFEITQPLRQNHCLPFFPCDYQCMRLPNLNKHSSPFY
jgi:hypothetical protein